MPAADPLPDDTRRLALLQALGVLDSDPEPAFDAIVRLAGRAVDAPVALLSLVDAERVWHMAVLGTAARQTPLEGAACVKALRHPGALFQITDLRADRSVSVQPWLVADSTLAGYTGAPIVVDGVRLGTVCVWHRQAGGMHAAQCETLLDVARLAGEMLASRLQARRWRLQEARVRTAGSAGSDWFWETDAEGRLTWVSEHVEQHLGVPARTDIGQRLEDLASPASHAQADWTALGDAVRERRPYRDLLMQRDTPRGTLVLSFDGVPVTDSTGAFRGYRGASRDVTAQVRTQVQRQHAEQLLRETQAGMAAVLSALPDLWFAFDAQDRYTEYGAPDEGLLACPFSELVNRTPTQVLPSGCADAIVRAMRATRESGQPRAIEYELTTVEGQARIFEARFSAMPAQRVLMIVRDVTEVRTLARRLLVMQRAIEADGSLPIVVCDASRPDLPLVYVSPAFERMTGFLRAEALGRSCAFLQRDDRDQAGLQVLRAALREGRPCRVELQNYRRDGSAFVNELHIAPVHDPKGALTHFIGVLNDVTERRQIERTLSISEERWSFALENSGDGVWDWDAVTDKVFFSKRWKTMLGHEEDEIGDSVEEWSSRIHPDDAERVMRTIWRHLKGATPNYVCEHRVRCKDGSYKWILDRGRVVQRMPDGQALRMIGTHTDITELREAQKALRDKQAAELANRAKTEFLSRMSHEMRTPLNAVLGFAQLLWGPSAEEPERVKAYASQLVAAGQHLLALIDDVLDLQRVEAGQLALTLEPVHLGAEVRHTLGLLAPVAQVHDVRLLDETGDEVVVQVDRLRLRQVLMNVLSNAIKYNRPGGRVRVSAGPSVAPGQICVSVEDTGVGMSADEVGRLFQPFERLGRETSGVAGTGLGLVIARRMTQEMGGSLSVSSRSGVGTRMVIALPQATSKPADLPLAMPDPAPRPAAERSRRARLLYVEDNEVNAMLFEAVVSQRDDVELRVVSDGARALQVMDDWAPDLFVLDENLPGLSGMAVYHALRRDPRYRDTPVFMCSAEVGGAVVNRAREAGFAGYWTKPIDVQRVLADLDEVLSARPA